MGFFGSLKNMASKAAKEVVEEALAPPPAQSQQGGGSAPPADSRDAGGEEYTYAQQSEKAIPGTIRMISGCQDAQTSADVFDTSSFQLPAECGPGGAGGACTNAMISTLANDGDSTPSWLDLLKSMRVILQEKKFTQVPQLSASRELDLTQPFSVVGSPEGKKRSLLIGINYVGQQGELRGCHNDVLTMKKYIESQGFPSDGGSMKVLMDDGNHELPTLDNILKGFSWLLEGAAAGDSLFLHYSGHGGSVRDTNGDEKDGKDETLIPLDYQEKGQLTDDVILSSLVLEVPRDVMLTAVIDACHSGTVLDLPYSVVADGATIESIANGDAPTLLPQNGDFNFAQLLKIGQLLYTMHQQGASTKEIATAAFTQFTQAGGMRAIGQFFG